MFLLTVRLKSIITVIDRLGNMQVKFGVTQPFPANIRGFRLSYAERIHTIRT